MLAGAAGVEMPRADMTDEERPSAALVAQRLRDDFAPFAPRVRIFWVSDDLSVAHTLVGIEVMSFTLPEVNLPQAGVVQWDPMSPDDLARADGALQSELDRIGIPTDHDKYEWRCSYNARGN
jgi:hypothetical protein